MSEPCVIEMCRNSIRARCYCCQKNFCRTHFIEHDNAPNFQLDLLADEINLLNYRLKAFNVEKLTNNSRQKFERWRVNCHKLIDDVFEEKCREIDQRANEKIEQQRDEISKIRSTVAELILKQHATMKDIDLLKATIQAIEERIDIMEDTSFGVVVRPLVIDDNFIHIQELYMPRFRLPDLPTPYRTVNHVYDSSRVITSNDRFLLIHRLPDLCLMDRELTVVKRSPWNHGLIYTMCWSSKLARFFVITNVNIFTVDENLMSIERIPINQNQRWFSCTCSDTRLYLSTPDRGSSILTFHLSPAIQFEKHWKSPETCTKDQMIMNVVYNNETLAITTVDVPRKDKRIELRSATTLGRLWTFRLNIEHSTSLTRCCSLNHGDWLVWNCYTSSLLHITEDGKLQATSKYNEIPLYAVLFAGSQLAILTDNGINFHRMKS